MNRTRTGMKKARFRLVAGVLLIIALGLLAFFYREISSGPEKLQAWQKVFSLTVHAADGTPEPAQPDREASYGSYRVTDSKAPGYTLIVNAEDADEIRLSASTGSFIRWNAPDYKVNKAGKEITIAPGETIYWTPLTGESPERITESELTMSAYRHNSVFSEARFMIRSDESGVYTGKWAEGD